MAKRSRKGSAFSSWWLMAKRSRKGSGFSSW